MRDNNGKAPKINLEWPLIQLACFYIICDENVLVNKIALQNMRGGLVTWCYIGWSINVFFVLRNIWMVPMRNGKGFPMSSVSPPESKNSRNYREYSSPKIWLLLSHTFAPVGLKRKVNIWKAKICGRWGNHPIYYLYFLHHILMPSFSFAIWNKRWPLF